MRQFILYFLFLCSLYPIQGFSVLSPLNESIRDMQQVLQSRELQKLPASEAVEEIVRTDTGFVVFTNTYRITIEKEYKKRSFLGPKQFELRFSPPEEL